MNKRGKDPDSQRKRQTSKMHKQESGNLDLYGVRKENNIWYKQGSLPHTDLTTCSASKTQDKKYKTNCQFPTMTFSLYIYENLSLCFILKLLDIYFFLFNLLTIMQDSCQWHMARIIRSAKLSFIQKITMKTYFLKITSTLILNKV